MVRAEISIIPLGTQSASVSDYVAAAVSELESAGLRTTLTATGTTVEAESPSRLYEALARAQEAVFEQGAGRAYTILKIANGVCRGVLGRALDALENGLLEA